MLHNAAGHGLRDALDVVELLLLKGADVHAQNYKVSGHLNSEKYILDTL